MLVSEKPRIECRGLPCLVLHRHQLFTGTTLRGNRAYGSPAPARKQARKRAGGTRRLSPGSQRWHIWQ